MKVLIISAEVWQDSTNGGNVLSNIFSGAEFEFAQIYCNPGEPENLLCKKYYQMTDSMMIRGFLNHHEVGRAFELQEKAIKMVEQTTATKSSAFYAFFHKYRLNIFFTARSILWNLSNWKNKRLKQFVLDFSPDIIFAPCYGSTFMLQLTRHIVNLTGKKVISYISDDSYTLKQFNLSPFYWINRFAVRRQLRKTFPYYSLVYTMTETQKEQCEKDFNANMKILLKAIPFGEIPEKKSVGQPIRLVYAGGIYLNRWKALGTVAEALREINVNGVKAILDIYTGNEISSKMNKMLNDGVNSRLHNKVSQKELLEIYHSSDIALHVESFDLANKLAVRMSFSTKIVDCLASGCAVMAICDEKQGGYRYLKDNDVALCISNPLLIKRTLEEIYINSEQIIMYAKKARNLCEINHNYGKIANMIKDDFAKYC